MPASRLLCPLNLRDLVWMLVVLVVGAGWWRDSQVLRHNATIEQDSAVLLRADNAMLEQENEVHRMKLRQLQSERTPAKAP